MAISKEEVLAELHNYVASHDAVVPGERTFAAATRIKPSAWKGRHWVRWTDAVKEAGYNPNSLQQRIPAEGILRQLAGLTARLGRFPVRDEMNMEARNAPGFPVWGTIKKRYGGMPGTVAALLEFSRETGDVALAGLCQARLEQEALSRNPPRVGSLGP